MTEDRSIEELTAIWLSLSDEEARFNFINDETTVREVYRLDQTGLLSWSKVLED